MAASRTTISGAEFKRMYPGKKFYKLTNPSENHNGLQFKDGLIEDHMPFDPKHNCSSGGIYFTNEEHIVRWVRKGDDIMYWIREIIIYDDAKVSIFSNKYKIIERNTTVQNISKLYKF